MFNINFREQSKNIVIRDKGKSLYEFPSNFVVLDLETTGLNPKYDDIIEIGMLKVIDNKIVNEFQSLIKPNSKYIDEDDDGNEFEYYIDEFIENLTGITNEMLEDAPKFGEISNNIIDFIGDDIIVGHNINFDINFLYDALYAEYYKPFNNDFWDLLKMSRRIIKELKSHKLSKLAEFFQYDYVGHRALIDCKTTYEIMMLTYTHAVENDIEYIPKHNTNKGETLDLRILTSNIENIDEDNYFYGKYICFTGKLENLTRKEAGQIAVNLGAINENGITKKTNFLVRGNFDYSPSVKNNKSSKILKAEKYILEGQELSIIDEDSFLDLIELKEV